MSKMIKRWECDVCGNEFQDKEKADHCETTHIKPIKVDSPMYGREQRYPRQVRVWFEDGKYADYVIERMVTE